MGEGSQHLQATLSGVLYVVCTQEGCKTELEWFPLPTPTTIDQISRGILELAIHNGSYP